MYKNSQGIYSVGRVVTQNSQSSEFNPIKAQRNGGTSVIQEFWNRRHGD